MEHFSCSSMWIPHHRTVLLRLVVFKGSRIGSISFLLSLNRRASGCTCLLLFESWSHVCLSPWSTRSPLIFTAVSVCSLSCSCVVVLWLRPATVLLHSADSLMCVCVCVRVILCLSVFACGLGCLLLYSSSFLSHWDAVVASNWPLKTDFWATVTGIRWSTSGPLKSPQSGTHGSRVHSVPLADDACRALCSLILLQTCGSHSEECGEVGKGGVTIWDPAFRSG